MVFVLQIYFQVTDCHVVLSNEMQENSMQKTQNQWKVHRITLFFACFAVNIHMHILSVIKSYGFVLFGQEIAAELGSMSESSDDEFLTTRIVRRRVVIQVSDLE